MSPGMDSEVFSEPDSTTAERDFVTNDDVLCQIRGDQMYLGIVVQVNHIVKECLVKFLDDTETWCKFSQMKLFGNGEEEVTCVVCKSSEASINNQIQVCACGRAYHQRCHVPQIPLRDSQWKCGICCPERRRVVPDRAIKETPPSQASNFDREPQCGKCNRKDDWYQYMLQCRRCRLWFHSACYKNISQPALMGDRFFVFVCGGCNGGREFCCRMTLTWMDLVHIVLYNLNKQFNAKYHDLDKNIMPFINKVWPELQLQAEMSEASEIERRKQVYTALQNCPHRFRCGREAKKRVTLYGLRSLTTPRQPPITLPERGPVDDHVLASKKVVLLQTEKPLQNGHINSSRKEMETEEADTTPLRPPIVKVGSSTEFLVKRSVPFPLVDASSNADSRFRSNAVRRAARLLRKRPPRPKPETHRMSDSEDEAIRTLLNDPSRSLPRFIPNAEKKKQKEVVNKRPQRNLLEARLNSTESKLYNPQAAAPQESPSKKKDKKKLEVTKPIVLKSQKNGKPRGDQLTEADSSGDEPILVKSVITRRLSEKDIVVDRQGVVRRKRRLRRHSIIPPPPLKYASVQSSNAPLLSLDELYNSKIDSSHLRDYLCPMPRVAEGSPCKVITRRVKPNGEVYIMLSFAKDDSKTS